MKKLKIILNCNITYIFLLFILIIRLFCSVYIIEKNSKYKISDESFYCTIESYYINGNQLKIILNCKEPIIGYYYFSTKKEFYDFKRIFEIGDIVYIKGTLELIESNNNFNVFNYKKYGYYHDIFYNLKIETINYIKENTNFIYKIKKGITNRVENLKSCSYIKAFILGDKNNINKSILNNYKNIGIMHVFAISGMHVSILISIIAFLLKKNNILKFILSLFFLIIYFLIVGSVSLLRSVIWFIISYVCIFLNINLSLFKKIFFLFFIILMTNPFYIFDVGFWYSILISSSIIFSKEKIKKRNYFFRLFYISFLSFLISVPINMYNFFEINFLSFIYNLFIVPFISFLFPFAIIVLIFPVLDSIFFAFTNILEKISLFFSSINSTIIIIKPPLFIVIIYYIIILLVLKNKKFLILFFLLFMIHFNYNRIFKSNFLLFLDVGQGDCILIHSGDYNILVDTGGVIRYNDENWKKDNYYSIAENTIIPVLKSFGISKIDTLILTHGDYDHIGESINLISNFNVKKVIFNNDEYNDLELKIIEVLKAKDILYYKGIKKLNFNGNVLYFLNNKMYDNENDNSNVIYLSLNRLNVLLMGDAGIKVENDLLTKYSFDIVDILKVGHHGSNTSTSINFINEIKPKDSIISVGKNNKYGHPNANVLKKLNNSVVYRTDLNGSIMFKIKNSKIKIYSYF